MIIKKKLPYIALALAVMFAAAFFTMWRSEVTSDAELRLLYEISAEKALTALNKYAAEPSDAYYYAAAENISAMADIASASDRSGMLSEQKDKLVAMYRYMSAYPDQVRADIVGAQEVLVLINADIDDPVAYLKMQLFVSGTGGR